MRTAALLLLVVVAVLAPPVAAQTITIAPGSPDTHSLSRRGFFRSVSGGIYGAALAYLLGRDLSGVIESCGPGMQNVRVGDAVFALMRSS